MCTGRGAETARIPAAISVRVELLTPQSEAETLKQLKDAFQRKLTLDVTLFGRFAEPKLRRALEQITDKDLKTYTQNFVKQLSQMRY